MGDAKIQFNVGHMYLKGALLLTISGVDNFLIFKFF